MSCVEDGGLRLASDTLNFSTKRQQQQQKVVISPELNSAAAGKVGSSGGGDYYLNEMNLKLLPAISNSIKAKDDPIKVSTSSLSRSHYAKKTSPHAVLGKEIAGWPAGKEMACP